ncbi:MAG: NAD-dependent epimerase/dehydratase family protein [Rhodospirillaceae bacterium]|nr:NAD-dependent epimerase/dehydratase family protein [Rhodospirillaceae bacterium]
MSGATTIAVTGATGFIGSRLIEALRRDGADVRALTRRAQPVPQDELPGRLTWIQGSLESEAPLSELIEGCDGVIHVAGAIRALNRDRFLAQNTEGTKRLAAIAAAQAQPPRFVYVSSLAAREPRLSPYALSKREAEKALDNFRARMSISIVRPPAVYGPGDRETLRIFTMAARGFLATPAHESARFSLIHVDDLVAAILELLAFRDDPGTPIEIDDGQPGGHSWASIAQVAGDTLQTQPRVIPLPAPLLYLGGAVGSLMAQLTQTPTVLSWSKVPELLHPDWVVQGPSVPGWTPQWDVVKGFKNTANWAISQGLLKSYG